MKHEIPVNPNLYILSVDPNYPKELSRFDLVPKHIIINRPEYSKRCPALGSQCKKEPKYELKIDGVLCDSIVEEAARFKMAYNVFKRMINSETEFRGHTVEFRLL
jgi:hypothetical protein